MGYTQAVAVRIGRDYGGDEIAISAVANEGGVGKGFGQLREQVGNGEDAIMPDRE